MVYRWNQTKKQEQIHGLLNFSVSLICYARNRKRDAVNQRVTFSLLCIIKRNESPRAQRKAPSPSLWLSDAINHGSRKMALSALLGKTLTELFRAYLRDQTWEQAQPQLSLNPRLRGAGCAVTVARCCARRVWWLQAPCCEGMPALFGAGKP